MIIDADPSTFSSIYLCSGTTDLRKSIDGLAAVVEYTYGMNPYKKNVLFLFCGRSNYKIKGLLW